MNTVLRNNPLIKELLLFVPNLAILVGRLALDRRIPTETKIALGAAALYLASPIDAVPDVIPVLGQLDDLFMVVLILDGVLNHIDPAIVREHWRGDPATLSRVGKIVARLTSFIPESTKARFFERAYRG